jgi:hypothetical protein
MYTHKITAQRERKKKKIRSLPPREIKRAPELYTHEVFHIYLNAKILEIYIYPLKKYLYYIQVFIEIYKRKSHGSYILV